MALWVFPPHFQVESENPFKQHICSYTPRLQRTGRNEQKYNFLSPEAFPMTDASQFT